VAARRAVSWLFFLNGALFGTWVSRLPLVQSQHGLSHGELGVALLGLAMGALIAMPLSGWASARVGSRMVCHVWAVFYSLLLPVLAFAPTSGWLMVALIAFGAGHGGLDVAMNAQAVKVEGRYPRPIMSGFHALFSAGGLAGAALGAGMAGLQVPVALHFGVMAAGLGGWVALRAFGPLLPEEPKESPSEPASASPGSPLPLPLPACSGRRPGGWANLLAMGALAFCVMLGEGAMADWTGVYLKDVTLAGDGLASAGYAAFSLTMMLGRFWGDRLTLRLGPVRLVRWSGVLAASGLALALVTAQPWAAFVGFAAVGAGFATVIPQVFSAAGRAVVIAPSVALATVTTMGYGGFLLGPPLIGFAAEGLGLRGALGIVVVTSALLLLLAGSVRPRRQGMGSPQTSLSSDSA
jgi:MFS family permease